MRRTFFTSSRSNGIWISSYDHDTTELVSRIMQSVSGQNDHHVAAVAVRPDGKLLVCMSQHNGHMRRRISANVGDVTSFGSSLTVVAAATTYPRLVYLSATDTYWLFYRKTVPGTGEGRPTFYITSTDGGVSWSSETQVTAANAQRPYLRLATNGVDRIDFFHTDGHPFEVADNNLYHFYYDGSWRESDGTAYSSLPIDLATEATQVYDGSANSCWVWDAGYISGSPVVLFAQLVAAENQRYRFAKWDGSAWADYEIAAGGSKIYEDAGETWYTAGGCFAADATKVYLCREVVADRWEMERWQTADGGETWSLDVAITSDSDPAPSKNYRPYLVQGGGPMELVWLQGNYISYTEFSSSVMGYFPDA